MGILLHWGTPDNTMVFPCNHVASANTVMLQASSAPSRHLTMERLDATLITQFLVISNMIPDGTGIDNRSSNPRSQKEVAFSENNLDDISSIS
ncbi:hypothetical protein BGZ94_008340 [Podila epigama]|nr:hypothetical protein BGZ94_008340 [Podila epigama]